MVVDSITYRKSAAMVPSVNHKFSLGKERARVDSWVAPPTFQHVVRFRIHREVWDTVASSVADVAAVLR